MSAQTELQPPGEQSSRQSERRRDAGAGFDPRSAGEAVLTSNARTLSDPPSRARLAWMSIVGFWLFYFVINTLRSFVLGGHENQLAMMGSRIVVTASMMAVTGLFWLALRGAQVASMRRSIIIAIIVALPAAVAYGAVNWSMFEGSHPSKHPMMAMHGAGMPASALAPPAPPPPPPPPAWPRSPSVTLGPAAPWGEEPPTPIQGIAEDTGNGFFFFIAWSALYLALLYGVQTKVLERRAAELRAAAQVAQLRALRYQVNPHFLFNTLNALSSLVLSDRRDEAEDMIANLAVFFRTSLQGDPTKDVSLGEEISLQRLYLDIEKVRFPRRLLVEIDLPWELEDLRVPGLILQPVVENAVKYGVSPTSRPVTITIKASVDDGRLFLSVEDDGECAAHPNGVGTGVGLRNVCDRLEARFGDASQCHWGPRPGGGFAVRLAMPALRDGG
ncbi:MAG: histidine kinase [Caulobacteraceae bacterium]|nr:histidine kinase [Caulobacteraceae bacterium]